MRFFTLIFVIFAVLTQQAAFANPYWDKNKVPKDSSYKSFRMPLANITKLKTVTENDGIPVLRIQADWLSDSDTFTFAGMIIEASGTKALLARSQVKPKWGSYLGVLKNKDGSKVFYDAVGTGKEYRKLTRAVTFRFPTPTEDMTFELYAENPQTGVMERVLSKFINSKLMPRQEHLFNDVEVKELSRASQQPELRVNFYAEGYTQAEKDNFYNAALKAMRALKDERFPGVEHMSFYAVFAPSNVKLGRATDLGLPVQKRDSFLGLYYPYWDNFGRWYHVIYPTREDYMRQGFAAAPYDYPVVLVNSSDYWGVGNYMAFTAIPANSSSYFTYLLMHEFGHYFGLNEEYQGGGRTELEFAPDLDEPWSQNITFLGDTRYDKLKWKAFVNQKTPLPTPYNVWHDHPPVYGAYVGGYADSPVTKGKSHIPGLDCTMESRQHFCDVCKHGIGEVVKYSLGV